MCESLKLFLKSEKSENYDLWESHGMGACLGGFQRPGAWEAISAFPREVK